MATYPDIKQTEWKETPTRERVKTEVGGYVKQRPTVTQFKTIFETGYANLTDDEKETLDAFFKANQTITFDFVHPRTEVTIQAQFDMDDLAFTLKPSMNSWSASVKIREI